MNKLIFFLIFLMSCITSVPTEKYSYTDKNPHKYKLYKIDEQKDYSINVKDNEIYIDNQKVYKFTPNENHDKILVEYIKQDSIDDNFLLINLYKYDSTRARSSSHNAKDFAALYYIDKMIFYNIKTKVKKCISLGDEFIYLPYYNDYIKYGNLYYYSSIIDINLDKEYIYFNKPLLIEKKKFTSILVYDTLKTQAYPCEND